MKIICISDTHSRHREIIVPKGDLIIHAGDICSQGNKKEVLNFLNWFTKLDIQFKILVAGNHDRFFEIENHEFIRSIIPNNIHFLNDSGITLEGVHFWGSPIQPAFNNWAFNRERGKEIDKHWQLIPIQTDVLITHGPPYGILDKTIRGKHVGCERLKYKVIEIKPKYHVFGHVHEGYGILQQNGIQFINASILNERYRYTNNPIVFNL